MILILIMFFAVLGFTFGLPLGFYFREHNLRPPVQINYADVKRAFAIFQEKKDDD